MAPGGPRARPSQHPQAGGYPPARPPQQGNVRNEVFENIFGRPSGAHHLGGGPPGHPGMARPPGPGYGGYPQHGGLLNPAQPSFPPTSNPAQPSFPPGQFAQGMQARPPYPPQQQGQHPPPQRAPSHRSMYDRYSQLPPQQGQPQPQPQPAPAPQASPYDGVSIYDSAPSNGYGSQGLRAPSAYNQGEPPAQLQQANVPNRRASLVQSQRPSVPPPGSFDQSGFPAPQNGGRANYNGYAGGNGGGSERLPHLSPDASGFSTAPTPMPVPHVQPRSVSATSSSSTATVTSVPPRSRSLHHGPNKISVKIPSPSLGPSSLLPFPEQSTSEERPASPPPDYLRAMSSVSLNSERTTPGALDNIPGIPARDSREIGTLKGPWEPTTSNNTTTDYFNSRDFPSRPSGSRHMSSSSSPSVRRSMHMRQPSDSSISSSIYTVGQRVAPLSQINNLDTPDSPLQSPGTPTGSDNGYSTFQRLSGRKSMESTHSLPLPGSATDSPLPPGAATSVFDHRAMSFSGSGVNRRDIVSAVRSSASTMDSARGVSGMYGGAGSPITSQRSLGPHQSAARKAVLTGQVIPALLSNVAEAFRHLIQPHEIIKDGIAYKDAFDGRLAVTIIADIIRTPDRNLALLLGRALDAQKFFHDVTYAHRLRDTDKEVYQFKERLVAPFVNDSAVMDSPSSDHLGLATRPPSSNSGTIRTPYRQNIMDSPVQASDSQGSFFGNNAKGQPSAPGAAAAAAEEDGDDDLPNGVFTLLTECYSPTCSREQLCYSINCPRRLEQMKRLNVKSAHPGLQRKLEEETVLDDTKETGTLWIHSVSQEILDSVDDTEKKRQEAINEVIYTERDFVRGLEYMRDCWVKPLRSEDVIPFADREEFIRQVFWNFQDVLKVNHVLAERLTKRQKQQPVVQALGDIFLEVVPRFEPFVVYGAHQLFGKYEFEKQKSNNPAFQKFVDETERKPESHKLELNGYLTKPTTRLGRYPLLLEAVLKYTPDDHPDKKDLPEVVKMIRAFLAKVNVESGKSENIFELAQLEAQLVFRPQENIDLRLRDKSRELIHKGPMKRRGGTQGENADLLAFLFDHAFLLVKSKWVNKTTEQYKVYRRPIPLELLVLITPEDYNNSAKLSASSRNKLISRAASKGNQLQLTSTHVPPKPESKHGFSLTVVHLGRKGYSLQLWVDTFVSRKKWVECIEKQQQVIRDRSTIFLSETITEGFFQGLRRINCLSPYDNGNRMIYGTDEGVYFSNLRDPKLREPVKVINLTDVTQVDVIEELQLLIVLHERSVTTFPLDCLDPNDPNAAHKRGKRISSHTSFFKSGICLGRTLIAIVKSSPLSSTIKVLEPVDQNMRGKKPQTGFMRRLNNSQDTLKVFKEFYFPLESFSVYFLRTKLCVGCQKGFEIVDLETLDMQSLLDPSDPSLDFVLKRDGVRPMAIYRIEGDFLLCYDEFAFYVNKNGWRARPKWAIIWEGSPTSFALQYPYVIAFEPAFIEVRHVESGHLVQIIPGSNINCLFADMPPSTVNAPPVAPQRQLMYPSPGGGGMYRPPPMTPGGYPQGQPQPYPAPGGFPQPGGYQQGMVRPPMPGGFGMPPQPMAPYRNFLYRPQVIFSSEDGHVQFLKLPPPQKGRRSSDSRSVHSTR